MGVSLKVMPPSCDFSPPARHSRLTFTLNTTSWGESKTAKCLADTGLPGEGYAGIGVAVSHDGGVTWQHGQIPLPVGFEEGAANPIVKFDGQGHVFVSFMAATFLGARPNLTDPDNTQRA